MRIMVIMKNWAVTVAILLTGASGVFAQISWNCGNPNLGDVVATLDTTTGSPTKGTLTISGSGDMKDQGSTSSPWYSYRSEIKSVIIEDGVTSVGNNAFYHGGEWETGYTSLASITIPNSVTSIGNFAFFRCRGLTTVTIPRNVTFIGSRAFEDCNLSSITSLNPVPPSISIGQLNSPGINGTFHDSWNAYLLKYH